MDKNKYKPNSILLLLFVFLIGLLSSYPTLIIESENMNESVIVSSEVSIPSWRTTWGGIAFEYGEGVAVDSVGNSYITGRTYSFGAGDWDAFLVKYDASGTRLWNTTWGGLEYDHGYEIAVDSEDNIYITGATSNFGAGEVDAFLVKYDASGTQLWNTTWGYSKNDLAFGLAVDQAGNVYISGLTTHISDTSLCEQFVAKYYSNGTIQWSQGVPSYYNERGNGIAVDSSGNIYITGVSEQPAPWDEKKAFLEKYTPSGLQLWVIFWDEPSHQIGRGVAVDSSDNIYITGISAGSLFLAKYNASGTQLWNLTSLTYECGNGISVDTMDNIYITGSKYVGGGFLVKYNALGVELWNSNWLNSYFDNCNGITLDSGDNIFITGTNIIAYDAFLVKNPNIPNDPPQSNQPPSPTTVYINSIAMINWTLTDDVGPGKYNIEAVGISGTSYYRYESEFIWMNGSIISYPINTTSVGTFNYTIYYEDSIGEYGTPSTVTVKIISRPTNLTIANAPEFSIIWLIFGILSLIVYIKRVKKFSNNNT